MFTLNKKSSNDNEFLTKDDMTFPHQTGDYIITRTTTQIWIPNSSYEVICFYAVFKSDKHIRTYFILHGDSSHTWNLVPCEKGFDMDSIMNQLNSGNNLPKIKNPNYKIGTMCPKYINDFELTGTEKNIAHGMGYGNPSIVVKEIQKMIDNNSI